MSRTTKLIVIASNLAAISLIATLTSRAIPNVFLPTLLGFGVACVSAFFLGDMVTAVVFSTIYAIPAACFLWFGRFTYWDYVIWLAAFCGSILPRTAGTRWALPPRFRIPLILWALTLALSWPIAVLREIDFVPAMLSRAGVPGTLGQSPTITVVWITTVSTIAMTGLLLIDWMFLEFPAERFERFQSRVVWPLLAGAAIASVVAVYQSTVDIFFLSFTFFRSVGRAVGTTADANAFGSAMALWVPVTAAMAARAPSRRVAVMWATFTVVLGVAVFGSGSRTALLATMIGLAVVMMYVLRSWSVRRAMLAAAVVVVVCGLTLWLVPTTVVGRTKVLLPDLSADNIKAAAWQLWDRDMYGSAAMQMIADHPLVGVGVGGFNYQYNDVLFLYRHSSRPPDNAQNWFRQQLAELGLLGSIGWIIWTCLFLWLLFKPARGNPNIIRDAVKGSILGLAAASQLGVPTQDTAVSISFAVFLGWYLLLNRFSDGVGVDRPNRIPKSAWIAVFTVLTCFLLGTAYEARTDLRRPVRALRVGDAYSYGFVTDTADPSIRWTTKKAVEVFPSDKKWFKITVADVAPDATANPVLVVVRLNRQVILRANRRANFPVTRWVRMPAVYGTPLMIEIDVSRTWRDPSDQRERGVAVREWSFSDEDPPKGSITFESPPASLE